VILCKLAEVAPLVADRVAAFEGICEYVATGSLDNFQGITSESITYANRPSRADLTVKKNDLCFARMQSTEKVLLITEDNKNFIYSTGFAVIRPNIKSVFPRFLFHLIKSSSFQAKKDLLCSGATQKAITNEKINSIDILLPPLAEQQRIASILDKAEFIKRKRELAIEKLDELEQSVFYDLLGKVDNFIPLANLIKDKVKHLETKADMVWSLSLEQIESNTGRLLEKVIVPKATLGTSTYLFKPPVILYSKLRPYLNKVITPSEDGYATTELVPLYIKEDILRQSFLTSYLRSKYFVEFANTNSGGAKMPRVMMDKLWQHPVPIPSMDSQIKFEKIFNVIKDKRARLEYGRNKNLNLTSSLQSQAFSGQL